MRSLDDIREEYEFLEGDERYRLDGSKNLASQDSAKGATAIGIERPIALTLGLFNTDTHTHTHTMT